MSDKKFRFDGRSRIVNDLYKENFNRIFNPTLTKNMPNVKWDQLPPRKGPNSQGVLYGNNKNSGKKNTLRVLPTKRND